MNLLAILLPLIIALTWIRLFRPGHRLEGTTLLVVPLPFLARLRMHVVPITLALVVGSILVFLDAMPWQGMIAPVVSSALLLLIPVQYTLTDVGIRLGWTEFRRWTEFAAVRRAPGGARLLGVQRSRGLHIWLSGSRGDDEFLQFLRETVRNAYKGTRILTFPAPPSRVTNATDGGPESPASHIVAFSGEGGGTRDIS